MNNIIIKEVSSDNNDFLMLCHELDSFLNIAIGGESNREKYKKYNNADTMNFVIVAYFDTTPIGCSALRRYDDTHIELKRVFVKSEYRKQHIGAMLLECALEHAKNARFSYIQLETGEFLADSVKLYQRYGFWKIENYGEYKNMPESLCMGRSLSNSEIIYSSGRWLTEEEIFDLFNSVNWESAKYPKLLQTGFKGASTLITAYLENKLVGLVEAIDDGACVAYVHYLLVHPDFQGTGIGSQLLKLVKEKYKNYVSLVIISEKKDTLPFYKKNDFTEHSQSTPLMIKIF